MSDVKYEMKIEDVVEIVSLFEDAGMLVVIDGGWAVDALLGRQTRVHEDLDVAVLHADVPKMRALLSERGFVDVPRDDTWECNFVMGDAKGQLIDFHSCTFDEEKRNVFGVAYEWEAWQGEGVIGGRKVRCIEPKILVDYHSGYEVDANDFHDVKLLCEKFGLAIPKDFDGFA